jgi:hypothetical protein
MLVNIVLSLCMITLSLNLLCTRLKLRNYVIKVCHFIKTFSEKLRNNCKLVQKEGLK